MSTEEEIVRLRVEKVPVYTDPDVARAINALAHRVGDFVREQRRCCPNCVHFDTGSEHCGLAKQRPPAKVIAFGCASYEFLPF